MPVDGATGSPFRISTSCPVEAPAIDRDGAPSVRGTAAGAGLVSPVMTAVRVARARDPLEIR